MLALAYTAIAQKTVLTLSFKRMRAQNPAELSRTSTHFDRQEDVFADGHTAPPGEHSPPGPPRRGSRVRRPALPAAETQTEL